MNELNEHKIHYPAGCLVRVVKKGETTWLIQNRFTGRPAIVVGHKLSSQEDDGWVLNEVIFDNGEKALFYDVELVRIS